MSETRTRIIEAATELHGERGVLGTSWDEIAQRAEVAPATVYRHFPSLVELIPACAKAVFDVARPPTLEEARQKFAGVRAAAERFARLIGDSCHCYAEGEAWLHAARRERAVIPAIDGVVTVQEQGLAVLVDGAVGSSRVSRRSRQLLCALCDFPFWKLLVDQGMSRRAAEQTLIELVNDVLEREGIT